MRTWKYYRARAEQFRAHNVFVGPLHTEDGDHWVHYVRQGKLGDGTDYFGIFCEDHAVWLKVQPKDLGLKEISAKEVPVPNVYTTLAAKKVELDRLSEDIGLEVVQTTRELEK